MTIQLTVNKSLSTTGWTIVASLNSDATIPREVFAYSNTGTTTLGSYQGVITPQDLNKMQIWSGVAIPVFGNAYVRTDSATIHLVAGTDPDAAIATLKESVQLFSTNYKAIQSTMTIYTIT